MDRRTRRVLIALALLLLATGAAAQHDYNHYHPDVAGRESGLTAFEKRDYATARDAFLDAALHADKGAQAMLAEMHWSGLGVPRDGAIAYVWADLAAERGYPILVAKREHYWNDLDASERERALAIGPQYYAQYGDASAKPRLEARLREGLKQATGSRAGGPVSGTLVFTDVYDASFVGGNRLVVEGKRADRYYMPQRWNPEDYWGTQDRVWNGATPPVGTVEVLPVESVPPSDPEN